MSLKFMHVIDKCIIELVDKVAFSSSAGNRRFQCLAVCLKGKFCVLFAIHL